MVVFDLRQFSGIFLPVPQRDVVQAKATAKGRPVQHEAYVLTRPEDAVDDNGRVFVAFTTDCLLQRQSELPEHAAADATYKACEPVLKDSTQFLSKPVFFCLTGDI
jgi:hypothetical protein